VYLIYKFTTFVRSWWSLGFTSTGPGPSCSQSFLSKDLWFPGQNFLFLEFSFKRSVVSELGVQADRAGVLSVEVLKPRSLLKLSPQSRGPKNYYFFTYWVPSPESRPIQVPSPNAQVSKTRTIKKTWPGRGGAQVCGTAGVSIKPGWWRSPVSPRRPGSRAINQALCHGWTRIGPVCFRGCRRHRLGQSRSQVPTPRLQRPER
jgi:hypothetical protein